MRGGSVGVKVAAGVKVGGGGVSEGGTTVSVSVRGTGSTVGGKRVKVAGTRVIGATPQPTAKMRMKLERSLAFKI
jgi:hypothetical protein